MLVSITEEFFRELRVGGGEVSSKGFVPTFSASPEWRIPMTNVTCVVCPLMLRDLSVRGDGVMPNSFSSLRFLSGSDARNPTQIVYNI